MSYAQGENLAKDWKMPFLEVSAKDGTNISEIFETIAKDIKDYVLDPEESMRTGNSSTNKGI